MIKGQFSIKVEIPLEGRDEITILGDFQVNSREELISYLIDGVDKIHEIGTGLLNN